MTIEDDLAAHDAREDGVYLVQVFNKEEFIQHAIFSEFHTAKAWIHELPKHYTVMCAPFILDNPEAGKKEKEGMN